MVSVRQIYLSVPHVCRSQQTWARCTLFLKFFARFHPPSVIRGRRS